eukprot:scaffold41373_cov66-Phaeocystis_antarctica.AAC.3
MATLTTHYSLLTSQLAKARDKHMHMLMACILLTAHYTLLAQRRATSTCSSALPCYGYTHYSLLTTYLTTYQGARQAHVPRHYHAMATLTTHYSLRTSQPAKARDKHMFLGMTWAWLHEAPIKPKG